MIKNYNSVILAGVASVALTAAMPVGSLAQDGGSGLRLEEIVVTARKGIQAESVQKIPESIKAFDSNAIEDAGITLIKDVIDLTPNFVLQPSFRLGVVNLSVRGHSTPQQGDSPVVINFDGVQAPAQDFINQDLFDIERIEVLKGPQGALYGAGAIAGAINVITKQPTNDFEGFAKLKVASGDSVRGLAGFSGPVVEDRLFFRLAGVYQSRDGYIRNTITNQTVDFLDEYVLRGTLRADFDWARFDLRASVTDTEAGASYYESLPLIPDPVPGIDAGGPLGRLGSDLSQGEFVNRSNIQTEETRDIVTVSLKSEFDLAGGVVTSISGYNNSEQQDFGDLDFQPINLVLQDVRFDAEVFNQELRYASDPSKWYRYVVGAFYQHREIFNQVLVLLNDGSLTGNISVQEARVDPTNILAVDGRDDIESDAWGVFLSTEFDLTDRLVFSAAVRYDEVDVDTAYVGDDPAFLALPDQTASRSFSEVQPKGSLSYNVTDDILVYGTVARGFRTGVPNPTAAFAGGLPRFIEPEIANTYEIGMKSSWFDNRVAFNLSLFHSDIKNRHHFFFGAALQSLTTFDSADVNGIEVDVVALLTEGLQLTASAGFMSAEISSDEITEYVDFDTGEVVLTVNNNGNTLPDTPETTINIALDYYRPLIWNVDLVGRVSYRYIDRIFFDTENFIDDGGDKHFVDLRIGLESAPGGWSVVGFVNNANDERTYTNYALSGGQGNYIPNQPRNYGVEFSYRF